MFSDMMMGAATAFNPDGTTNTSIIPATPVMTGNTTPSGVASASGTHTGTEYPWMAYDQNTGSRWMLNSLPGWSQYQFPVAKVINKVGLYPSTDYYKRAPGAFNVVASNDGSGWVTLFSISGLNEAFWASWSYKYFGFTNGTAYTHYRLNVTGATPEGDGYTGSNDIHWIEAV